MFRNLLNLAVFLVGLAAVCWIGASYIGSNPLGAVVALVIGVCYLAGAFELYRYRQATASLQQGVADLSTVPPVLGDWLTGLHPSLRNAVRLRVEGERVALPAPVLTPYLVGLLVLLGMLGTLLGMMATLRGTGLALESATDLQAMRGSLAAPVKGLGFAFGTSIAGVAASAMLGLLSALCRRERLQVVQWLDVKIASTLRIHSQTHQREEAFRLLQQQTELMPSLIERLQTMMTRIEQHSAAADQRQLASQEAFHASTGVIYTRLASSVEQALKESVAESARAASAALEPVVSSTMAGLARETTSLHGTVTQAVQKHLDGLSAGFEKTTTSVAGIWTDALAQHRATNDAHADHLRTSLERFSATFEQGSEGLIERVSARLDASALRAAKAWEAALSTQEAANETLATRLDATAVAATDAWNSALSRQELTNEKLIARLDATATSAVGVWDDALSKQKAINDTLAASNQQALAVAAETFETHAASLIRVVNQSHADLQAALASRDEARIAVWTQSLASMTAALDTRWEQAGERAATQQQDICDTLARTATDISAQTQAHASATIAEISRLVEAASEAPKVAAEVVGELRQKLSESMVRDTAMLEERSRLLATLETLLDAVNHASTEQRVAVDALVTTSADLLDRVSTRFAAHIEGETGKLETVAAQLTGSAIEVASLGESVGAGVQLFGQYNDALMERLQHIATALDASLVRSDEQLAYYVAQAREVVDLSVLSQKQIIEDLQRLASHRAPGTETA